jgi:tetratricopeptide (TPR) repeat protein
MNVQIESKACAPVFIALCALGLVAMLVSCSPPNQSAKQRAQAAKTLFDQTLQRLHLPSADTNEVERTRLLTEAARNYERLLGEYPEQSNLCAQAWRSLGNIRASQTNLNEAVRCFAAVAERYPGEDWEIVQAWKSAADLLWDASRRDEARRFYGQIVARFDATNAAPVVKLVVRGAKSRLAG